MPLSNEFFQNIPDAYDPNQHGVISLEDILIKIFASLGLDLIPKSKFLLPQSAKIDLWCEKLNLGVTYSDPNLFPRTNLAGWEADQQAYFSSKFQQLQELLGLQFLYCCGEPNDIPKIVADLVDFILSHR